MLAIFRDGTHHAGRFDLLGIVQDTSTGRYHITLWLEHPFPSEGWATEDSTGMIRLKSKFHHTAGAATFEEALQHIMELRSKIVIDDICVWDQPEQCFTKDFKKDGYASIILLGNWRKNGNPFRYLAEGPSPDPPTRLERLLGDPVL